MNRLNSTKSLIETRMNRLSRLGILAALSVSCIVPGAWAQNANTGAMADSVVGNGSAQFTDTGIGVNGQVQDSSLNNNQNTLYNANSFRPTVVAPTETRGGNSALVLPRNPLPMPNAALGRSNFGMQVGVQNNPGIFGGENSLGWFAQAGVTVPFGKIPDAFQNPKSALLDDQRRRELQESRDVFGKVGPSKSPKNVEKDVKGRVMGLSAYNYSTIPSGKLATPAGVNAAIGEIKIPQPRVIALAPADVFSQPLNTGEKIGVIQVGKEYPYIGHTKSGWIKLILPNGAEGWTASQFEYLKNDFTEVDSLATAETVNRNMALAEPAEAAPTEAPAQSTVSPKAPPVINKSSGHQYQGRRYNRRYR